MTDSTEFDLTMTLGDAIRNLRATESADFACDTPPQITQVVEQHDAVHVLFGCGTSLQDEIAVHVWMMLATTAKMSEMHQAVASQEHQGVLSGIGHLQLVNVWLRSLPRLFSIVIRSLQMEKRVAMERLAELKEQPIFAIRQAYGIRL